MKVINVAVIVFRAIDLDGIVHIITLYSEVETTYIILLDKFNKSGLKREYVLCKGYTFRYTNSNKRLFCISSW